MPTAIKAINAAAVHAPMPDPAQGLGIAAQSRGTLDQPCDVAVDRRDPGRQARDQRLDIAAQLYCAGGG